MLLLKDRALLDAFRRGEEAALTKVYLTYTDEVARSLATRVGVRLDSGLQQARLSPLDLEAAHQETFVRAFRPAARMAYDGLRPYLPYLLRIAHSTAIDLLRSAGKLSREAIPLEEAPEHLHLHAQAPSPEQDVLEVELREVVRHFLERLPPGDRELARLRFIDGLSQEMAAAGLALTRSEVRTRERHIRMAFERHLRQSGWLAADEPERPPPR